jgi:GWxTD domain-containing protein
MKLFSTPILLFTLALHSWLFILNFSSCTSSSRSTTNVQNIVRVYNTKQDDLHPQFSIFHRTGTTTELHFKINSKELLYSKQVGDKIFSARIELKYRLISAYETSDILDSGTVVISDPFSSAPKDLMGKIDISATFTNNYLLRIDITDLNRVVSSKTFIHIDKLNHNSRQNFIVLSAKNKTPIFRDNIGRDENFIIKYRTPAVKMHVRYYNRVFPLPAPPFASSNATPFDYNADSLFTLQKDETDTLGITLSKPGFYHIQADTNSNEGLTLFRFADDFPFVKKQKDLLEPLRYLTSKQEYELMTANNNSKKAVDSFWVTAGGDHDRARELVRKFYTKVEYANKYFSSYIEGWKTDRGLIYIVYGPPSVVYKASDSESWEYGEANNFNSLTFTFLKVINPFTDEDYRLERNPIFKTSWFNAVEMWRQGRVNVAK